MDKQAQEEIAKIEEIIDAAKPQTVEEWEAAYRELLRKYARLHKAAERVTAVSLAPGICTPTWKGENGMHRKIVATNALDELHAAVRDDGAERRT